MYLETFGHWVPLSRALKSYRINAPINVKPARGGGGGVETGHDLIVSFGPGVKH